MYTLTDGKNVNIKGATVGKSKKIHATDADTYYLKTGDGKTMQITYWDYSKLKNRIGSN